MAAQKFPDLPKTLGKEGAFSFSAETFVDAFDHTAYKETVWNFSEAREENSIDGLELHGWGAWPDPVNWSEVIPLQKAAKSLAFSVEECYNESICVLARCGKRENL